MLLNKSQGFGVKPLSWKLGVNDAGEDKEMNLGCFLGFLLGKMMMEFSEKETRGGAGLERKINLI